MNYQFLSDKKGIDLGARMALAFYLKQTIVLKPEEIGHLLKQIEYLKSEEYANLASKV